MCTFLYQLSLLIIRMFPFAYICTKVNNTTSKGWTKLGSIVTDTSVNLLIHKITLLAIHFHIQASNCD